jgi:hypothetical protein
MSSKNRFSRGRVSGSFKAVLAMLFIGGALAPPIVAAPIITYSLSTVGSLYQYTYTISGYSFAANQELDIDFDPALYGTLSNGVAPSGFDLLLFQPNNPPQAFGEYSALALTNNPSLIGTFSVEFTYLGSGVPQAQTFNIYDDNFVPFHGTGSVVASGTTVLMQVAVAPEPATGWLLSGVLGMAATFSAVRRNYRRLPKKTA